MVLPVFFAFVLCVGAFMLWTPVQRFREELPGKPLYPATLAQVLPLVLAWQALKVFRVEMPPTLVVAAQPAVGPILCTLLAVQLVATFIALGRTSLTVGKKVVYSLVSTFGALLAFVLIAYFSR